MKPRLLDLFCGAGGAAMGYHRAGFEVVGVDIKPQPHYPFEFHQADALTYPLEGFDAYHASPPCQRFSIATPEEHRANHSDMVAPIRSRLSETRKPFVIENVKGAPVRADFCLTGDIVGLPRLVRERWFETNWLNTLLLTGRTERTEPALCVVGHGTRSWVKARLGYNPPISEKCRAMGIDWMNRDELSQAIPPAYTEYIGAYLLKALEVGA